MVFITYHPNGRTGNNLIQYLACKLFSILFNHTYVKITDINTNTFITINDNLFINMCKSHDIYKEFSYLKQHNICLHGYFQWDTLYIKFRHELINNINESNDILIIRDTHETTKELNICEFLNNKSPLILNNNDIIINIRLDDFENNYIDYMFYFNILDNIYFEKIYIVVDKINKDWEKKYINKFNKYNPIILSNSFEIDFSIIKDSKILIHSNSTFCWIASFFGCNKIRFIPQTNFYSHQRLNKISLTDVSYEVNRISSNDIRTG